jgi:hypothetical protein
MVKRHGKVEIALMCVNGTSQENLYMGPVGISLSRSTVIHRYFLNCRICTANTFVLRAASTSNCCFVNAMAIRKWYLSCRRRGVVFHDGSCMGNHDDVQGYLDLLRCKQQWTTW